VVVERGVQAVPVPHGAELLPQRVPGPPHHPGATHGSKHTSSQGKTHTNTYIKIKQTQAPSLTFREEIEIYAAHVYIYIYYIILYIYISLFISL